MAKKVSIYGLLTALAFVLNYIEMLIPLSSIMYGMKIGLANIVVLAAFYLLDYKGAFIISIIRIILAGITFGNMSTLIYSLAGGMLAYTFMALAKKSGLFGIQGVSIIGGVAHNTGQLIVAVIVLETKGILLYAPFLFIVGAVAGLINGIIGGKIVERADVMKGQNS